MSRFNETKEKISTKTVNHEGGVAFNLTKRMELCSLVGTSILKDVCYEKADLRLDRMKHLVSEIVKEDGGALFIGKLASYTRNKLYLRTVSEVLLVELAKVHNGDDIVRRATNKVIIRADEIAEVLSYWKHSVGIDSLGKKAISKQLRLGLADRFNAFDEYQFKKYFGNNKKMTLRDAMFLVHAKPKTKEFAGVFKKIAENSLASIDTWETKISETGGNEEKKTEAWETLIMEEKLGYMACLRNLRNIAKANVSKEAMIKVHDYLSNEKAIYNSKQFPVRFLSAYEALKKDGIPTNHLFFKALEKAMIISAKNIGGFNDTDSVLVSCDVSGSMSTNCLGQDISCMKMGLLMGTVLARGLNFCDFNLFATETRMVQNLDSGVVLENIEKLQNIGLGGSTYGYKVLELANKLNKKYDKIVMFTDCELYGEDTLKRQWQMYKEKYPEAKLIIVDLAGNGTSPVDLKKNGAYMISGWSDRIFDSIEIIENSKNMLKYIDDEEI